MAKGRTSQKSQLKVGVIRPPETRARLTHSVSGSTCESRLSMKRTGTLGSVRVWTNDF